MIAPALRQLARGLRYNVDQARADLARMAANWSDDMLFHQGYQNGRVAAMESVAEFVELAAAVEESADAVALDVADWARWPEVQTYAGRRGITDAEALRHLVNCGLSHQIDDDQDDTDDRIARHEEFLASEGADHLFRA